MKKVLFPFEIDRRCYREAYVYAVAMARNLSAELILLNAFYVEADNDITKNRYNLLLRNNWLRAYREIHDFHGYYLNNYARSNPEFRLKTDHRFIHGNLVDEFRIAVHREKIDFVVLPATDVNESARRKIKLMRREALNCSLTSLLITPHEITYKPIKNFLFAYSLKEQGELFENLDVMIQNTSLSDSTIHLVHLSKHGISALEPDHEPFRSVLEAIQKRNQVVFHGFQEKHREKEITDYIAEHDIQLLAFTKSQFHAIGNYFRRHIIEELCSVSKIPVLILKETDHDAMYYT